MHTAPNRRRHGTLIAACGVIASWASCAHAADVNPAVLTQAEFRQLSEDMGGVASFKPMIPSESSGVTGFDVGIAGTGTRLEHHAAWEKAANGASVPSTLPMVSLRVHKGLPFNLDIGGSFSKVPSTNVQVLGGELRWAFVPGGIAVPAVALRASISSVSGVDNLSLRTAGLDLSISKGFAFLTPYVGVGTVRVQSRPDVPGLADETLTQSKVFAGLNLNFGLANLLVEGDRTGGTTSYGLKFGLRF